MAEEFTQADALRLGVARALIVGDIELENH